MNNKFSILFLSLALILSVFSFNGSVAFADQTIKDAIPLSLNAMNQYSKRDENNYYKVTLPSDGMLEVKVSNEYGYDQHFAVIDDNGGQYSDYIYTDDSQYASGYSSQKIGLAAGTYYIKHVSNDYYEGFSYKLGAYFTPSDLWEKEWNGVVTQATDLKLNKVYSAAVNSHYDDDFYSFTLVKDGFTDIKVSNAPYVYQKYELFTIKNGKKIDMFYNTTDDSEYSSGYTVLTTGLPKGKYYVRVTQPNDEYDSSINKTYKIIVNATYTDFWEKEDNNTVPTSTTLSLDHYYHGYICYGDYDFYKLTLSKGTHLQLNALNDQEDYMNYQITDSRGNERFYLSTNSGQYASGHKTGRFYLPAGTYYLRIDSDGKIIYDFAFKQVTPTLGGSNVTVTNYKSKSDTIYVKGIKKDDVVKVYNSKNKLIATKKSTGTSTTATVKQLGKTAGYVYVTLTRASMLESGKLKESYKKE
ncbi:hypothetical protein M1K46_02270 [Fictibacillus sp. WQ 8-8]|uniref:hypothetical protein n=1 Tax=Fictibacillus sp. WQ 8-8 TaxID=2938788 RepID=UPI00210A154F|nr:hypothetical protein [Fictibacillus sp. WQ 8-8]MCQ6264492.1 hypothetical protein [Fictibacillus sp. WQ 8-8]